MTCCCAARIKYRGEYLTLVGADSEVSDSTGRLNDLLGDGKLYRFHDTVVAINGMGPMTEALLELQENQTYMKSLRFTTKRMIRKFVSKFFGEMRGLIEEAVITPDILQQIGILLVVTPGHVYSGWNDLSIFEHGRFYTTGAGADKSAGAMEVLYDALEKVIDDLEPEQAWEALEDIVHRSISASCKTTFGVGEPICLERVMPMELPEAPKRGRKKKVK